MNSLVIYDTEHESHMDPGQVNVYVYQVVVGAGDMSALKEEFRRQILDEIGQQPASVLQSVVLNGLLKTYHVNEKEIWAWKVKLSERTRPTMFANWLVETKGWVNIDNIESRRKR